MTNNFTPYGVLSAYEIEFMDAQRWAHRCHEVTGITYYVTEEGSTYQVRETPAPGINVVYTTGD